MNLTRRKFFKAFATIPVVGVGAVLAGNSELPKSKIIAFAGHKYAEIDTYQSDFAEMSDVIYHIDPADTPFLRMVPKTKATTVLHEWQASSLTEI